MSRHEREQSEINGGLSQEEWLVLFALCAVSVVACFVELGTRGLWLDEIGSVLAADHHGMSLWSGVTFNGGNMLLYYLLLHVVVSVLGDGQLAVRIPSALAGVALIPVVFFLSRRMFGSRTAVIATSLVAVSPALVVWDQQARGYSLGTLLIASCLLALFRALESPSTGRWCVYGLLVVLSIYTIVYAALFLVAQLLPLLFLPSVRRQAKSILLVVGVAVLAYVPLIVLMLRTGAANVLNTNGAPSIDESVKFLQEFASGIAPNFFAATAITAVVTVIGVLCWIAGGAELLSRARRVPFAFETVCLGVVVSWLFVPLLLDAICSLAYRSIYNASFLLQSVPAGALLVAFVIVKLLPKVLSFSVAAALVALLLAALVPTYGVSYEKWPQASRFILTASRSGDCLTVNKEFVASNLAYYFHIEGPIGPKPQLVLPTLTWSDAFSSLSSSSPAHQKLATVAASCKRIWLVLNRVNVSGGYVLVNGEINWFVAHGFKHTSVWHFVGPAFGINVVLLATGELTQASQSRPQAAQRGKP